MKFDLIRPVLKDLIGDLSGLLTLWESQSIPFRPQDSQAFVLLSIFGISSQGIDEIVKVNQVYDNGEIYYQNKYIGNRFFTLSIKVKSRLQTYNGDANYHLEQIRNKIVFTDSLLALNSVNCSLVNTGNIQDISESFQDRQESIAVLDLRMFSRVITLDPTPREYLKTVEFQGNL